MMSFLGELEKIGMLKTLKDTLLEYIVIHMEEIFPQQSIPQYKARVESIRECPCLPGGIFDQILQKSTDMFWVVCPDLLISCFVNRHKLKWRNINYFLRFFVVKPHQIKLLCNSLPKPRELYLEFKIKLENEFISLRDISQIADTLEILKIHLTKSTKHTLEKQKTFALNIFEEGNGLKLKLTKFLYNAKLESFPLLLDSSTLNTLVLDESRLTKSTLEMIVRFKSLKRLSLQRTRLHGVSPNDVVDSVITLTNLRILDLTSDWCRDAPDEDLVTRLTSNLPRLEILQINKVGKMHALRKKLKVLVLTDPDIYSREALMNLAEKVGDYRSLEGLLTISECTSDHSALFTSQCELFSLLQQELANGRLDPGSIDVRRIERAMLKPAMCIKPPKTMHNLMLFASLPCNFSQEFIQKVGCLMTSCNYFGKPGFFTKFQAKFLKRGTNTHVAKKLANVRTRDGGPMITFHVIQNVRKYLTDEMLFQANK